MNDFHFHQSDILISTVAFQYFLQPWLLFFFAFIGVTWAKIWDLLENQSHNFIIIDIGGNSELI